MVDLVGHLNRSPLSNAMIIHMTQMVPERLEMKQRELLTERLCKCSCELLYYLCAGYCLLMVPFV